MNNLDWIKNIYFLIKQISDKEFQERVWVKGLGPEVSSYTELMCGLYDDFQIEIFLEKHLETGISDNLYKHLLNLSSGLKAIKEGDTDKEIIENLDWIELRELARIIVKLFDEEFSCFAQQ